VRVPGAAVRAGRLALPDGHVAGAAWWAGALMDNLEFKFHALGGCIGGRFCQKAVETAPNQVLSVVLQNAIGLHPEHPE
jgi:hypothetical protein